MVGLIAAPAPAPDVTLRPLLPEDRPRIHRWMADPEVVQYTVLVPSPECAPAVPYGRDAADRYLETLMYDPTRRAYAIMADGVHVGNVGLKELREQATSAECFVEIGERRARGRGIAKAAMGMLLDDAFFGLQLEETTLGVFEFNAPALALYSRLGFSRAGHYGWHWAAGRYWEVWKMRLARTTWAATPLVAV